jgi:hypothetical protein
MRHERLGHKSSPKKRRAAPFKERPGITLCPYTAIETRARGVFSLDYSNRRSLLY